MRTCVFAVLVAAACFLPLSCGGGKGEPNARQVERRDVVAAASGPAQALATVAVGAKFVDVVARSGAAVPKDWRPSDDVLDRLISAERTLLVGLDFEPWAQRAGLPPSRTITLESLIDEGRVIRTAKVEHTHGSGPAHSHGGTLAEAWTDPDLFGAMLHGVAEALSGVVAKSADADAAILRRAAFTEDLDRYRTALAAVGEALGDRTLIAADHGLEYAARAGGWPLAVTLVATDDGRPNDLGLGEMQALAARGGHAGVLVWPGPIDAALATKIEAQLGLTSVSFDLGAAPSEDAGTLERLIQSTESLLESVK